MTADIVLVTVHGFVVSGTSRVHVLWFNESSSPDSKVQETTGVQVGRPGVHQAGDPDQVDLRLQTSPYQCMSSDERNLLTLKVILPIYTPPTQSCRSTFSQNGSVANK